MVKVKIIFQVGKPIEHVFKLLNDISDYNRWAPDKSLFFIENIITSEGPIGLGTTYIDRLRFFGKSIGEIIQYEPPFEIEFQQKTFFGLPVFGVIIKYTLNALHNSTEVTHRVEAKPYGIFKLFEPVLSLIVRSERERTCHAIKQSLEQK